MIISSYISALLYDYECVVVPGLGGFISNEKPAGINNVNHQFNPPYSQIFFNVHLTTNDGLLINHIQKQSGLPYNEVRQNVDQFVSDCLKTFESGEKVFFENIGSLEFDQNKNIRFEQIEEVNYNTNAFGLSSFISPAIKRQTDEEKIRGLIIPQKSRTLKPADRKPTHRQKSKHRGFVKLPVIIALAAVLIFSMSWGVMNRDHVVSYIGEQASIFSFNHPNPQYQPRTNTTPADDFATLVKDVQAEPETTDLNDQQIDQAEVLSASDVNTDHRATEALVSEPSENILAEVEPEPEIILKKEEKIIPVVKPAGKQYYIIAGSFSIEKNAGKLVNQLRAKGFEAIIADTSKSGMFRVAYLSIDKLSLAKEKLFAIRQEDNAEAWLLRK